MGASPDVRRAVLLGAGMGLGLACLEAVSTRGWWGGLAALVSLVPVAVALALGGPLAAALAGGVAMTAVGVVRGGPAMLLVALKYVLPGATLGLGLVRRWPIARDDPPDRRREPRGCRRPALGPDAGGHGPVRVPRAPGRRST